MKAVHLINRREKSGLTLKGLTRVKGKKNTWRSCCWAFSEEEARSLIGGWIYLHPIKKKKLSEFGGVITGYEAAKREIGAIEDGFAFTFEAKKEGRGQNWRGLNYIMAWTSGIIDASFEHELHCLREDASN